MSVEVPGRGEVTLRLVPLNFSQWTIALEICSCFFTAIHPNHILRDQNEHEMQCSDCRRRKLTCRVEKVGADVLCEMVSLLSRYIPRTLRFGRLFFQDLLAIWFSRFAAPSQGSSRNIAARCRVGWSRRRFWPQVMSLRR